MATVTGLTADRMLQIEAASVVDGEIIDGNLILTKHDGTQINAGPVLGPPGPTGPMGPVGAIPGEVKLWSGTVLPDLATYGKWVWADGAYYLINDYPIAAANIADQWNTFAGASDPGPLNFRVPDLRGLVPAGLDAMPGGARANRMTRSVAITIAAKTGEETHVISVPEMPPHAHGVNDPTHDHTQAIGVANENFNDSPTSPIRRNWEAGAPFTGAWASDIGHSATGITIQNAGGGGGHETVQPTVMVPYIVCLDT